MAKALTAAGIRTMRPGPQRIEVKDGASTALYLCLQPSGHRSFIMRFRDQSGKPAKLTLGVFDPTGEAEDEPVLGAPLTLAAARKLCAELLRDRARGQDIVAVKKAAKAQHREASENTYPQAVRDFIEGHARPKTRRWKATAKLLGLTPDGEIIRKGLCDIWNGKPLADIKSGDIYNVVDGARVRGVPGIPVRNEEPSDARARHLHAALSSFFSWASRNRRVEVDPTANVHAPHPSPARDRYLSDAEIKLFWKAADAEPTCGVALKLCLLLGQRLNEVAGLRRSELAGAFSLWSLPAARVKNKRPHSVPLPGLARQLLESVPNLHNSDLIFTTNGRTCISGWSKIKGRLDRAMGVENWRLHDLRRTAVTGMNELGIQPHVIERIVNHVSGRPAIAGVYDKSTLMPERRAGLERWAAHISFVVGLAQDQAVVIPLRA